ncbi:MAG: FAD-binding oxidoreductase [Cellulosilyticum sp.]|nr:FAD-binding oxidoreductase [Cellulosilyticum sp.]
MKTIKGTEMDLTGLTGHVVTRADEAYEAGRMMWNRAIEKYPLVICYCKNEEDIRNSILWGRKHEMPVRIRSGRHHYDGYSTGNDVLIIDVSEMNTMEIDEEAGTITIDGGVRNRELYEFLAERGYPFPGGTCPAVGAVGYTLGGGWGYSGRLLGLGCDAVEEIRMINAEGELIVANKIENKELFWALKGSGGGQFGVVTSIRFTLPPKQKEATLIRVEYREVEREEQIKMFACYQEIIQTACDEVNFKLSIYHSKEKGRGMLLLGAYYGNAQEAHQIIAPFIQLGHQMEVSVKTMSVIEMNRWLQDAHPEYENYKSSGRFVNEELTTEQIHMLLDSIEERANGSIYAAISCYGMGGQMRMGSHQDASFYYRDSLYILGCQTVWEDNQYSKENREWFKERFPQIEEMTAGSFVNFPAGEIRDYKNAYYGEHQDKLAQIKRVYDPYGVFNFEQSL